MSLTETEQKWVFIITDTTFSASSWKERRWERKGRQKQGGQRRSARDEREQRKLPALQQHSFSVRHLLFYCNLMALLSLGASRQSPLYHMAIISVALLCDSLTLGTVTCDPLQPNQPGMEKERERETKRREGDRERERGGKKGWKNERER